MKQHIINRSLTTVLIIFLIIPAISSAATRMQITVDATELPRKLLHSRITLDLGGDTVSLLYPKWIPGVHGPGGPIENLAGFTITGPFGKTVRWERDWADIYRFLVYPDQNNNPAEVSITYICNQNTDCSWGVDCDGFPEMGIINWNTVAVYPEGEAIRDILVELKLILPDGWQYGSALPFDKLTGDTLVFLPVTFEELVDMPLICGRNFRTVNLATTDKARYFLHIIAHDSTDLIAADTVFDGLSRLALESEALFTRAHFDDYHFLLILCDSLPHVGVERRNSSINILGADALRKLAKGEFSGIRTLLPHEFVHAWCGKYRRPAGMNTPDYQTPKNMDMLWVYEGLTMYLGDVLSARSGLLSPPDIKELCAYFWGKHFYHQGRRWRPLRDTEVTTYTLWGGSDSWYFLRRGADYYNEGELIWLEFDARIRMATNGEKSLDDFCAAVFSKGDPAAATEPLDREEIVATLQALADEPWDSLITVRLDSTQDEFDPEGVRLCGYTFDYTDKKSQIRKTYEKRKEYWDFYESLGLAVEMGCGQIVDVVPESPADRAGLYAGAEIIGVNGKRYTYVRLEDAIRNSGNGGRIVLQTFLWDTFKEVDIEYRGGLRYHTLIPIEGRQDWLTEIIAPKTSR